LWRYIFKQHYSINLNVTEISKYLGGKVVSSTQNVLLVQITFDENVPEPRNGKFEVDEDDVAAESRVNTQLTFKWCDLVEPRLLPNGL